MNFFISNAYAQSAISSDSLLSLAPLVIIFVVFYFLLIRPQSKRQKEHKELIGNLSKGDEVTTAGGMLGKVTEVKDDFVKMSPYGASVSAKAKGRADEIKQKMLAGQYPIFKGPLKDNKGKVVIPAGVIQEQTAIELESMNYLVAGVIGKV